jgi:hypothetical protein
MNPALVADAASGAEHTFQVHYLRLVTEVGGKGVEVGGGTHLIGPQRLMVVQKKHRNPRGRHQFGRLWLSVLATCLRGTPVRRSGTDAMRLVTDQYVEAVRGRLGEAVEVGIEPSGGGGQ